MATRQSTDSALRLVLVVLAVVVLAPVLLMLLAVPLFGFGGGMMGGGMMGGAGAMGGSGLGLVWLAVLAGGGYLVYRGYAGDGALGGDAALEELRLAYARGDLSEEEFEERRTTLARE